MYRLFFEKEVFLYVDVLALNVSSNRSGRPDYILFFTAPDG
jgi:hypothetical protein